MVYIKEGRNAKAGIGNWEVSRLLESVLTGSIEEVSLSCLARSAIGMIVRGAAPSHFETKSFR